MASEETQTALRRMAAFSDERQVLLKPGIMVEKQGNRRQMAELFSVVEYRYFTQTPLTPVFFLPKSESKSKQFTLSKN